MSIQYFVLEGQLVRPLDIRQDADGCATVVTNQRLNLPIIHVSAEHDALPQFTYYGRLECISG